MSIDQSVPQHSVCVLLHYQAVALLPFADDYRLITTGFSTVIFLQRACTSLVRAHAGRTQAHVSGLVFRCAPNQPQMRALSAKEIKHKCSIKYLGTCMK